MIEIIALFQRICPQNIVLKNDANPVSIKSCERVSNVRLHIFTSDYFSFRTPICQRLYQTKRNYVYVTLKGDSGRLIEVADLNAVLSTPDFYNWPRNKGWALNK